MALARWSLDKILFNMVGGVLLILGVMVASYVAAKVTATVERGLLERGQSIAHILEKELADDLLIGDRLSLQESLFKAVSASPELRYLCIQNAAGDIVAHTFRDGVPASLGELWSQQQKPFLSFHTSDGPMANLKQPMLSPALGILHIGISRNELVHVKQNMARTILLQFLVGGFFLLLALRFIAAKVSKPLRILEEKVSQFPKHDRLNELSQVGGTREVAALASGFAEMGQRLQALEEERQLTQQRMIHAERLAVLGELAAGLAHEIHNPLDGMQECLLYLQEDHELSEKEKKYYPMLHDGLARIGRTMREMLTFARSGQNVCNRAMKVSDVLDSVALLVDKQLDGRKVQLTWGEKSGCACVCDKHALSQAWLNLILNAAEAAETNAEPEVRTAVRCDSRWVYLTIEDNGPGVPPELRRKIFEPFFTTKATEKGTGLGLSVSRELIWASGGELSLDDECSSLGGAKFKIKLRKVNDNKELT